MNWLRLIRYKNLLIVFFTQLLVWYCLIYNRYNFLGLLRFWDFLPIALSTLLIAAAGYIINDYFDIKIDLINRPDKVILEKRIPLRAAIIAHVVLNVVAMALVVPIAYHARHLEWLLVQVLCIVLLWFYSTHFKRQFVIGNVVVALLTALTVIVLLVYEPALRMHYFKLPPFSSFLMPALPDNWMFGSFAFFAFMLTWMREIVKDMEDHIGDAEEGCVTMPIKMGLQFSRRFAQLLGIITIATLAILAWLLYTRYYKILGIYIALLFLTISWWCFFISRKNTVQHYSDASKWLKIIMVLGIGSLYIYHITIQNVHV
jgi:4-hydroxybenzoate polyprenyltransferase